MSNAPWPAVVQSSMPRCQVMVVIWRSRKRSICDPFVFQAQRYIARVWWHKAIQFTFEKVNSGPFHTAPAKSENGVCFWKRNYHRRQKSLSAPLRLGLITFTIVTSSFLRTSAFKMFPSTLNVCGRTSYESSFEFTLSLSIVGCHHN